MPELEIVDLADLRLSPLNPRATPPSDAAVAALAASIAEVGLVQGLCGHADPENPDVVHVTAGGLRLRALQHLAALGRLPEALQGIPVLVHDSPAEAAAAAVAENEARRAMGPGDQYRAIAQLRAAGRSRPQIAAALATDEAQVARILALDRAAPEVLAALDAGQLTLDQARAFTIEPRATLQRDLLDRWDETPSYTHSPHAIRSHLRQVSDATRLGWKLDVVGRTAYAAAGGRVTADLFSEFETIDHPEIVDRLFTTHVAARCAQALAEGWAWADYAPEALDYPEILWPAEATLTDTEREFLDAHGDEPVDGESPEVTTRREGIRERLEIGDFSPDQMAVSGVQFTLTQWNGLLANHGLVREADLGRARELGLLDEGEAADGAGGEVGSPAGASGAALSLALSMELTSLRTVVIAEAVAGDPELALDLLAWTIRRHPWPAISTLHARPGDLRAAATLGVTPGFAPVELAEDPPFTRSTSLPQRRARNALLARWFAGTLQAGTTGEADLFAQVEAAAEIHIRDRWTPDATFLARLTVPQLEALWEEIAGTEVPSLALLLPRATKTALVEFIAEVFAGEAALPEGIPPDFAARARHWLPAPIRPQEGEA